MKRKLSCLLAAVFVGFAFLSTPPPTQADFCETMFGCQTRKYIDFWECECNAPPKFHCTICCIDGFGCCWDSVYCVE